MRLGAPYPIAARDMLFARYDDWGAKEGGHITFSIEHEDFPHFPKVVRAEILLTGTKVQANEANTEVQVTYLAQINLRGSIPGWMANLWSDGFVQELKSYHKIIQNKN